MKDFGWTRDLIIFYVGSFNLLGEMEAWRWETAWPILFFSCNDIASDGS